MADDPRDRLVRTMVQEGTSDDDIRATLKAYDAQPGVSGPKPQDVSMADQVLADSPADPWDVRFGKFLARTAKANPVQAGAMVGGALASGGTSIPASIGLAALGGAGGAGYGQLAKGAMTGDVGTPGGNAATMAKEGALSAAGEGLGQGVTRIVGTVAPKVYRAVLAPSKTLQREFGDVAQTGFDAGLPVNAKGAAEAQSRIGALSDQVDAALQAKDALRPNVAGYLPPAQGVPLPSLTGTLMRDAPEAAPYVGTAAHGSMVNPREIAQRGLGEVRSELSNRALTDDATGALDALQQRFLAQRGQPMTLQDVQAMKQAEQELANAGYRAEDAGNPVNAIETRFHQGVARGSRAAIEDRVPSVGPLNAQTQDLMGVQQAIENATMRNPSPTLRGITTDLMPGLLSSAAIKANQAAPYVAPTLLRSLLAALGGG